MNVYERAWQRPAFKTLRLMGSSASSSVNSFGNVLPLWDGCHALHGVTRAFDLTSNFMALRHAGLPDDRIHADSKNALAVEQRASNESPFIFDRVRLQMYRLPN